MPNICPTCDAENPSDARRCACGATLVYDMPGASGSGTSSHTSGLLGAVAAAGVAAAFAIQQAAEKPSDPFAAAMLIAIGAFSAAGAVLEWRFFMEHRKARFFTMLLGRTGTRYFYALLGGGLAGAGVGLLL